MKLFLIRHAHSLGNEMKIIDSTSPKYDLGLSEKGKQQAKELIPELSKYDFDIFIVSSLSRTIDTIQPFLDSLKNSEVIVDELTLERNAGDFIGMPLTAISDFCDENNLKDKVSFQPKNGESILEVYERAKKFLTFLKDKYGDKTVLICGHQNFLQCLKLILEDKNIMDFYSFDKIENKELLRFDI